MRCDGGDGLDHLKVILRPCLLTQALRSGKFGKEGNLDDSGSLRSTPTQLTAMKKSVQLPWGDSFARNDSEVTQAKVTARWQRLANRAGDVLRRKGPVRIAQVELCNKTQLGVGEVNQESRMVWLEYGGKEP